MECLIDYIGLKDCDTGTSPSGLFINQLAGVELAMINSIADEDQADYIGVWNDVQARAALRFKNDIKAIFAERYKLKQIYKSIDVGKIVDTTNVTTMSNTKRGFKVELNCDTSDYAPSNLQVFYVQTLNFYSLTAAKVNITIEDLDTNTDLFSEGSYDAIVGWNAITINQTFVARRIFISVETTNINVPALDISTINNNLFYNCGDYDYCFDCGCGTVGKITGMSEDVATSEVTLNPTNTFGVSAIFSIQCQFEPVVCNNLNVFASAWLYLLGSELMDERIYTSRLNEYTLFDKVKAKELKKIFEAKYKGGVVDDITYYGELNTTLNSINLNLNDACLECNHLYQFREAIL